MINATELKIGDYVQDDTGRIGQILELSNRSIKLKMEHSILELITHKDKSGLDVYPISNEEIKTV